MLFDYKDVKDIYTHNDNTFLVKNDGTLWATGYNEFGQLGLGHNNNIAEYTKLDDNVDHVLAIKNLTIIKKDGKYYVAGEHHDNVFKEYRL